MQQAQLHNPPAKWKLERERLVFFTPKNKPAYNGNKKQTNKKNQATPDGN